MQEIVYVDLTLYGYSQNLILLYQFYSMNLSIKHLIVISMCLYALYGRIQVGVRPDIFWLITSQIIYVVRLMSGSCHARFLVATIFRILLFLGWGLVLVRFFTAVSCSTRVRSMLCACQAEMSGRIHAPIWSDIFIREIINIDVTISLSILKKPGGNCQT